MSSGTATTDYLSYSGIKSCLDEIPHVIIALLEAVWARSSHNVLDSTDFRR
ncbi:hypothetical protein PtA15_9A359 [Puccinia triticina]|uniref:Uncharacterized protein n=1 Tax=Puccinia triticina TaxID=208348 RepID=A0ABY7CW78_9BASI|nr:uncharacterized protein PtA15_9A359 [Puccinia triticina]WAQ88232.1 hypothetical protein PtA15_9A359 [Puccinia triticina]WAR60419.1 hypothetical protein PtB15_9B358 [Puccinia triticina]